MDMVQKIHMAESYAKISEAELARRCGKSSQAFGQRLKTGKFTIAELEEIAKAMGAEYKACFVFPDGQEV